jgi:hypothetical protein
MNDFKPSTGIWRYMDVGRFLALISEKKLYFARLHELEDPWEGARSATDPLFSRDPEYVKLAASNFNDKPAISCWHENEGESVAMWKLYVSGREGVAIKTTVSLVGQLLSGDKELKFGRVEYRAIDDNDPEHRPKAFVFESGRCSDYRDVCPAERALFRKNKGYEHEREVRAVIYDNYSAEQAIWEHPDHLIDLSLGLSGREPIGGKAMPVDVSQLIKRIVVSPGFPSWALRSLQNAVDAASIVVKVELSALLDQPPNDTSSKSSSVSA